MSKILIADDNYSIRELLSEVFSGDDMDVEVAENGAKAYEMACQKNPDVIILDIWMPGQDGLEALREIKGNPSTQDIPVVMLSAMPVMDGESEAFHLGASHYITKPWDMDILKATVRVALRESLSTNELAASFSDEDYSDEDEPEEGVTELITTGGKLSLLEQRLEGGLPLYSVTLIEGASSTGKSVFSQHLTYGALTEGHHTSYFTSQYTQETLAKKMSSIGLDVSEHVPQRLRVYELPDRVGDEPTEPILTTTLEHIRQAAVESDLIIVDAITDLAAPSSESAVLDFFMSCKRVSSKDTTIVVAMDSYAFGSEMFNRLGTLCDSHFSLRSEKMRDKAVKSMEILKINTTELSRDNVITFIVEPKIGIHILPYSKSKA